MEYIFDKDGSPRFTAVSMYASLIQLLFLGENGLGSSVTGLCDSLYVDSGKELNDLKSTIGCKKDANSAIIFGCRVVTEDIEAEVKDIGSRVNLIFKVLDSKYDLLSDDNKVWLGQFVNEHLVGYGVVAEPNNGDKYTVAIVAFYNR